MGAEGDAEPACEGADPGDPVWLGCGEAPPSAEGDGAGTAVGGSPRDRPASANAPSESTIASARPPSPSRMVLRVVFTFPG